MWNLYSHTVAGSLSWKEYLSDATCPETGRLEGKNATTLDICKSQCLQHPVCSHIEYWTASMFCNLRFDGCESPSSMPGVASYAVVDRNFEWKLLGINKTCIGIEIGSPQEGVNRSVCLESCQNENNCSSITHVLTSTQQWCSHFSTCPVLEDSDGAESFELVALAITSNANSSSTAMTTSTTARANAPSPSTMKKQVAVPTSTSTTSTTTDTSPTPS